MKKIAKALLCQSATGRWLGVLPWIRRAYRDRVWGRTLNVFYGVYGERAEALAAAPAIEQSWYVPLAASIKETYTLGRHRVEDWAALRQPSTFPVSLWLGRLLSSGSSLVDYGGGGGEAYLEYARYHALPTDARWTVYDLPEVVARADGDVRVSRVPQLRFTSDFDDVSSCDILLASGSVQYFDIDLEDWLDRFTAAPRYILINKVALIDDRPGFYTLQNLGFAGVPYRVFNRDSFLAFFRARGYELLDAWRCADLSVAVPFEPDCMVEQMSGMVFEMKDHAD